MVETKQRIYLEDLKVGMTLTKVRTVREEDVDHFAAATDDYNPIHFDPEAARATGLFKDRIIHGLLTAGYISGIVGMEFPGPGCIFRSLNTKFLGPVFIGDTVEISLKIINIKDTVVMIEGVCTVEKEPVLSGSAFVGVQRRPKAK